LDVRGWAGRLCPRWFGRAGALGVALGVSLAAAGCYTLLSHPRAGDPVAGGDEFTGECLRCHSQTGVTETGYTPWMNYLFVSQAGWINYYDSPHWLDSRWARLPQDTTRTRALPSQRLAWGRVPLGRGQAADEASRQRDPFAAPPPVPGPVVGPSGTIPSPPAPAAEQTPNDTTQEKEEPKTLPPSGRGLRR
jgi:hypothetical protein